MNLRLKKKTQQFKMKLLKAFSNLIRLILRPVTFYPQIFALQLSLNQLWSSSVSYN